MASFNLTARINLELFGVKPVIDRLRREINSVKGNLDLRVDPTTNKAVQEINKSLAELELRMQRIASSSAAVRQNISGLGRSFDNASTQAKKQTKSQAGTNAVLAKTAQGAAEAASEIEEFGRVSGLAIRRFAGFTIATGAIFGLINAIREATSEAISFERELAKVAQVSDVSLGGLKGLTDEIRNLATGFGVSSRELLTASRTLRQAGFSATDTKDALEALALTDLAPTFDSIATTTEGAIAVLRQFGLEARDLESVLGSINQVAGEFAVESGDIIAAIRRAGGVFSAAAGDDADAKRTVQEFIALFTSVRATTRETAESIAVGLRTIFSRIQRGSTIESLRQLGVELLNAEGQFIGGFKAVEQLSEALRNLATTDPQFAAIVEELGGIRQIGKIIPVIKQFATSQEALKAAIAGQDSLTKDAAVAQETLQNALVKTRERFLELIAEVTQSSTFQTAASAVLGLANTFITLADSLRPLLPLVTALAAAKSFGIARQFVTGFRRGASGQAQPGRPEQELGFAGNVGQRLGGVGSSAQVASLNQNTAAVSQNTNSQVQETNAERASTNSQSALINALSANRAAISLNTSALTRVAGSLSAGGLFRRRNTGGPIRRFARGGIIPGSSDSDTVDIKAQPGEYILTRKATKQIGSEKLDKLNRGEISLSDVLVSNQTSSTKNTSNKIAETSQNQSKLIRKNSLVDKVVSNGSKLDSDTVSSTESTSSSDSSSVQSLRTGGMTIEKLQNATQEIKTNNSISDIANTKKQSSELRGITSSSTSLLDLNSVNKENKNIKESNQLIENINRERFKQFNDGGFATGGIITQRFTSGGMTKSSSKFKNLNETEKLNEIRENIIQREEFGFGGGIKRKYLQDGSSVTGTIRKNEFSPRLTSRGIAPGNVGRKKQFLQQRVVFLGRKAKEGSITEEELQEFVSLSKKIKNTQQRRTERFSDFLSSGRVEEAAESIERSGRKRRRSGGGGVLPLALGGVASFSFARQSAKVRNAILLEGLDKKIQPTDKANVPVRTSVINAGTVAGRIQTDAGARIFPDLLKTAPDSKQTSGVFEKVGSAIIGKPLNTGSPNAPLDVPGGDFKFKNVSRVTNEEIAGKAVRDALGVDSGFKTSRSALNKFTRKENETKDISGVTVYLPGVGGRPSKDKFIESLIAKREGIGATRRGFGGAIKRRKLNRGSSVEQIREELRKSVRGDLALTSSSTGRITRETGGVRTAALLEKSEKDLTANERTTRESIVRDINESPRISGPEGEITFGAAFLRPSGFKSSIDGVVNLPNLNTKAAFSLEAGALKPDFSEGIEDSILAGTIDSIQAGAKQLSAGIGGATKTPNIDAAFLKQFNIEQVLGNVFEAVIAASGSRFENAANAKDSANAPFDFPNGLGPSAVNFTNPALTSATTDAKATSTTEAFQSITDKVKTAFERESLTFGDAKEFREVQGVGNSITVEQRQRRGASVAGAIGAIVQGRNPKLQRLKNPPSPNNIKVAKQLLSKSDSEISELSEGSLNRAGGYARFRGQEPDTLEIRKEFLQAIRSTEGRNTGGRIGLTTGGRARLNDGGMPNVPVALTPGELVFYPEDVQKQGGERNFEIFNKTKDPNRIPKLANGGGVTIVPGSGNTDSFYTSLPEGSFVINKKASEFALENQNLNTGGRIQRFNSGGSVLSGGGAGTKARMAFNTGGYLKRNKLVGGGGVDDPDALEKELNLVSQELESAIEKGATSNSIQDLTKKRLDLLDRINKGARQSIKAEKEAEEQPKPVPVLKPAPKPPPTVVTPPPVPVEAPKPAPKPAPEPVRKKRAVKPKPAPEPVQAPEPVVETPKPVPKKKPKAPKPAPAPVPVPEPEPTDSIIPETLLGVPVQRVPKKEPKPKPAPVQQPLPAPVPEPLPDLKPSTINRKRYYDAREERRAIKAEGQGRLSTADTSFDFGANVEPVVVPKPPVKATPQPVPQRKAEGFQPKQAQTSPGAPIVTPVRDPAFESVGTKQIREIQKPDISESRVFGPEPPPVFGPEPPPTSPRTGELSIDEIEVPNSELEELGAQVRQLTGDIEKLRAEAINTAQDQGSTKPKLTREEQDALRRKVAPLEERRQSIQARITEIQPGQTPEATTPVTVQPFISGPTTEPVLRPNLTALQNSALPLGALDSVIQSGAFDTQVPAFKATPTAQTAPQPVQELIGEGLNLSPKTKETLESLEVDLKFSDQDVIKALEQTPTSQQSDTEALSRVIERDRGNKRAPGDEALGEINTSRNPVFNQESFSIRGSQGSATSPKPIVELAKQDDKTRKLLEDAQKREAAAIITQIKAIDSSITSSEAKGLAEQQLIQKYGVLAKNIDNSTRASRVLNSARTKAASLLGAASRKPGESQLGRARRIGSGIFSGATNAASGIGSKIFGRATTDEQGFRERRGGAIPGIGRGLTSLPFALLSGSIGVVAQQAIGRDTAEAAGTGSAISGATIGAASGAQAGLIAGPIGAAVGGIAGAIVGGVSSYKQAYDEVADEIRRNEADKAIKDFTKSIEDLGDNLDIGNLNEALNKLGDQVAKNAELEQGNDGLFADRGGISGILEDNALNLFDSVSKKIGQFSTDIGLDKILPDISKFIPEDLSFEGIAQSAINAASSFGSFSERLKNGETALGGFGSFLTKIPGIGLPFLAAAEISEAGRSEEAIARERERREKFISEETEDRVERNIPIQEVAVKAVEQSLATDRVSTREAFNQLDEKSLIALGSTSKEAQEEVVRLEQEFKDLDKSLQTEAAQAELAAKSNLILAAAGEEVAKKLAIEAEQQKRLAANIELARKSVDLIINRFDAISRSVDLVSRAADGFRSEIDLINGSLSELQAPQIAGRLDLLDDRGFRGIQGRIASFGGPATQELNDQLSQTRGFERLVPQLVSLIASREGISGENAIVATRNVLESRGLGPETELGRGVQAVIENFVGNNRQTEGENFQDLRKKLESDLLDLSTPLTEAAQKAADDILKVQTDVLNEFQKNAGLYSQAISDATDKLQQAAELRVNRNLQLREALGEEISVGDVFQNLIERVNIRTRRGGAGNLGARPDEIADEIRALRAQQVQLNQNRLQAANRGDEGAFKASVDALNQNTRQQEALQSALDLLGNDVTALAKVESELADLQRKRDQGESLLERVAAATFDPKAAQDLNREIIAAVKVGAGRGDLIGPGELELGANFLKELAFIRGGDEGRRRVQDFLNERFLGRLANIFGGGAAQRFGGFALGGGDEEKDLVDKFNALGKLQDKALTEQAQLLIDSAKSIEDAGIGAAKAIKDAFRDSIENTIPELFPNVQPNQQGANNAAQQIKTATVTANSITSTGIGVEKNISADSIQIRNQPNATRRNPNFQIGERRKDGGFITGFADGGSVASSIANNTTNVSRVSGTVTGGPYIPSKDTIPAMLQPGEFVVRRSVATKNAGFLERLNRGGSVNGFKDGGFVQGFRVGGDVPFEKKDYTVEELDKIKQDNIFNAINQGTSPEDLYREYNSDYTFSPISSVESVVGDGSLVKEATKSTKRKPSIIASAVIGAVSAISGPIGAGFAFGKLTKPKDSAEIKPTTDRLIKDNPTLGLNKNAIDLAATKIDSDLQSRTEASRIIGSIPQQTVPNIVNTETPANINTAAQSQAKSVTNVIQTPSEKVQDSKVDIQRQQRAENNPNVVTTIPTVAQASLVKGTFDIPKFRDFPRSELVKEVERPLSIKIIEEDLAEKIKKEKPVLYAAPERPGLLSEEYKALVGKPIRTYPREGDVSPEAVYIRQTIAKTQKTPRESKIITDKLGDINKIDERITTSELDKTLLSGQINRLKLGYTDFDGFYKDIRSLGLNIDDIKAGLPEGSNLLNDINNIPGLAAKAQTENQTYTDAIKSADRSSKDSKSELKKIVDDTKTAIEIKKEDNTNIFPRSVQQRIIEEQTRSKDQITKQFFGRTPIDAAGNEIQPTKKIDGADLDLRLRIARGQATEAEIAEARISSGVSESGIFTGSPPRDVQGNIIKPKRKPIIPREDAIAIAKGEIRPEQAEGFFNLPKEQQEALLGSGNFLGKSPGGDLRRGLTLRQGAIQNGRVNPKTGNLLQLSPEQNRAIQDFNEGKKGPVTGRKIRILNNLKENKSETIREANKEKFSEKIASRIRSYYSKFNNVNDGTGPFTGANSITRRDVIRGEFIKRPQRDILYSRLGDGVKDILSKRKAVDIARARGSENLLSILRYTDEIAQMNPLPTIFDIENAFASKRKGQKFINGRGKKQEIETYDDYYQYLRQKFVKNPNVPLKLASGGSVPQRFAVGGAVGADTVPAMLQPGEFIVKRQVAMRNGGFLQKLNAGKVDGFAKGGFVGMQTGGSVPGIRSGMIEELFTSIFETQVQKFQDISKRISSTPNSNEIGIVKSFNSVGNAGIGTLPGTVGGTPGQNIQPFFDRVVEPFRIGQQPGIQALPNRVNQPAQVGQTGRPVASGQNEVISSQAIGSMDKLTGAFGAFNDRSQQLSSAIQSLGDFASIATNLSRAADGLREIVIPDRIEIQVAPIDVTATVSVLGADENVQALKQGLEDLVEARVREAINRNINPITGETENNFLQTS